MGQMAACPRCQASGGWRIWCNHRWPRQHTWRRNAGPFTVDRWDDKPMCEGKIPGFMSRLAYDRKGRALNRKDARQAAQAAVQAAQPVKTLTERLYPVAGGIAAVVAAYLLQRGFLGDVLRFGGSLLKAVAFGAGIGVAVAVCTWLFTRRVRRRRPDFIMGDAELADARAQAAVDGGLPAIEEPRRRFVRSEIVAIHRDRLPS